MLCGCGKDMSRLNYNYDMTKYVELESYAVEVDTSSEEYKEYYGTRLSELLVGEVKEGKVEDGDTANIDYVGKKDGIAFSGGTAKGYDLVIGSGSFIDGFEEGLIGVEIGTTVDLDLTFPSDYGNAELAGKAVVFTVTVNHVKKQFGELNEETAKACGYGSAAEMEKIARDYAVEMTAWDLVEQRAKIEKYPEDELDMFTDEFLNSYEKLAMQNNMTLEMLANYSGMTVEQLEEDLRANEAADMSRMYSLSYYIIDTAGVKVTEQMVEEKIAELGTSASSVSRNYIEAIVVNEMAFDVVFENATVK